MHLYTRRRSKRSRALCERVAFCTRCPPARACVCYGVARGTGILTHSRAGTRGSAAEVPEEPGHLWGGWSRREPAVPMRGVAGGWGGPVSCCCRDKWRHDEWWNAAHLVSYSSGGQKSKVGPAGLKSRCWQGCAPSGGSKREEFSSLSLFEGPRAPAGSWPPPSVFKASIFRVPLTLPLAVWSHSRTFLRTLEIMLGSSR